MPIYRLPPYVLGPKVYMANDLGDVIDWGLKAHNIPKHHLETEGEGIVVGVADTGRPDHDDLNDNILASRNFSESHTDEDTQGHSTHVCGTIAAIRNDKGVIGVAPKVKLVTAKVLGDDGSGTNYGVAQGVRWLVNKGCDIINMSLGGPHDPMISAAVQHAVNEGVFVICAAGNEGFVPGHNTVGYPAKLESTFAVASYNKAGRLSEYSSRGNEVHIAAPGEDILSTWPGGGYRRISGTSMASPFVAGVVALLLSSQNKAMTEGCPADDFVANNADLIRLASTISDDRGPVGHDEGFGWGVINVDKLLKRSSTGDANTNISVLPPPTAWAHSTPPNEPAEGKDVGQHIHIRINT